MSTMTFDNSESNLIYKNNRISNSYQSDDLGLCRSLGPALIAGIAVWALIISFFV